MKTKWFFFLTSLIMALCLGSCVTAETAKQMPVYMFIHSKSDLVNTRILYDANGKYSTTDIDKLLKSELFPLVFTRYKNDETGIVKVEYDRDMRDLSRTLDLKYVDFYTKNERNYIVGNSDVTYGAGISASASATFDRVFEYEISPKNPQVRVTYLVNPIDLIREQVFSNAEKNNIIVLFSYELFAPEMFYEHMLSSVKASTKIPIIFNGEAGLSSTNRINMANTFVIRKYLNPELAHSLLSNTNVLMFTKVNDENNETFGDKLQPSTKLRFKFNKTTYQLTQEYARHLNEEHVFFTYKDYSTDENAAIEKSIKELSKSELVELFKKMSDSGSIAITKGKDFPSTILSKNDEIEIRQLLLNSVNKNIMDNIQ